MKYCYPCVFTKEEGVYIARFPDWEERMGGVTQGKTWPEAKFMAKDLLSLMCLDVEETDRDFPSVGAYKDGIVRMVHVDTETYAKEVERWNVGIEHRTRRYRMLHKAQERYWFRRGVQDPQYDTGDIG